MSELDTELRSPSLLPPAGFPAKSTDRFETTGGAPAGLLLRLFGSLLVLLVLLPIGVGFIMAFGLVLPFCSFASSMSMEKHLSSH